MSAETDRTVTAVASPTREQHQLRAFHPWGARAGREQEKTSRGVEAVARLFREGRSPDTAIDRWQTGRSPCAISILRRGKAVCPSLSSATLGADRPIRLAPLFRPSVA